MERTHFSLVTLSIFILLTVRCWCEEEAYNPLTEAGSDRDLKRFDDIGYDSFLGLMGRRNAALTNRDTDHSLADLLGWRTSMTSLRGNRYAEKRGGGFTDHGRLRMERFV